MPNRRGVGCPTSTSSRARRGSVWAIVEVSPPHPPVAPLTPPFGQPIPSRPRTKAHCRAWHGFIPCQREHMERSHQCRRQPCLVGKGAAAGPTPVRGKGWSRPAHPFVQPEPAGVRAFQPTAGVPPADVYAGPGRPRVHRTIVHAIRGTPIANTKSAPSVYRKCKMGGHCADVCPKPKQPSTAWRAGTRKGGCGGTGARRTGGRRVSGGR